MAFFGSDGLEHQLKQIKAQLASKDYEISSVRNELRKKDDELVEARKQRESTSYRLQEEEAKAHQAETALKQKTTANVDALGATNEEGRRLQQECTTLQAKVKDLERQLCRAKEDQEAFRVEASSSHKSAKRPNVDFFGATLSPAPKRGNRRRSTSLSSDNRLSELEAEVEMLRSAQGPSTIELDKLKTQLVNAKKELDKVTNAKLALERSSAREMDELKSRLEDANYELEDWRRNDGSGLKAGIENAKKAARQEIEELSTKVQELEAMVQEKQLLVDKLPAYESQIEELRTALELAQGAARDLPSGIPTLADSSELSEKIAELEKELAAARSAAPSVAMPTDKASRQLQREISKLKGQISGLEEELATQDDEILRLRGALPLPGSPSLTATTSAEDIAKIELLEGQLEEARAQVTEAREKLEMAYEQNQSLHKQLEVSLAGDFLVTTDTQEANAHRATLETELSSVKSDVAAKMIRAAEAEQEILAAQETSLTLQEELRTAKAAADDAWSLMVEHQQQLAIATHRCTELEASLAARSDLEEMLDVARSSLVEQTRHAAEAQATLEAMQTSAAQHELAVQHLRTERDVIQTEVQGLKDNVNDLITRLADEEDRSKAAVASAAEKKAYLKSIKEKYKEATIERDAIQLRLADAQSQLIEVQARAEEMQDRYEEASKARLDAETALEQLREEVADRSTESQARERDLELVNQKADVEQLTHALETQRVEHNKELELATFAAEQDLHAAKARLEALEKEVEASIEAKRNLVSASDKIRQLRAERDQLRTTLHFVNHEQRFTSEEAATHRVALEAARMDLEERTNAICRLQSDYDDAKMSHGHVSAELEAGLAEAQAARDTSVRQVADLELRLQEESKQAVSLVNDLRGARDRALHAEIELSKMTKVYKQMEADYDLLKLQLDVKLEAAAKAERESTAVCESPKSATSSESTRQRRVSGLPSPSWDMVVKLKEANASFRDRVERRDVHIRNIENELKQAKVNLQLAQDAAEENMVDSEDRSSEISRKEAVLKETRDLMGRQAEEAQLALDAMRKRADSFEMDAHVNSRSLQEVIVALAAEHQKARTNASAWRTRMAMLQSADERVDRIKHLSSSAMNSATDRIIQLSEQVKRLESQVQANEAALSASREQEVAMRADLQAQLDAAGAIEATLRRELAELEASLAERTTQLDGARSSRDELEAALEAAKAEHQSLLADAEERVQARQGEVSELLDKLTAADKHRGATEQDLAVRQAAADELANVRSDMESLRTERDTLLESLRDMERVHADIVREHKDKEAAREGELRDERQVVQARLDAFKAELEAKVAEIARLAMVVVELEGMVADLGNQLSEAERQRDTDQTTIADVQSRMAETESRAAAADTEAANLAKELEDLQASLRFAERATQTAQDASRAVQAEVGSLRQTNVELQNALAEAKDASSSGVSPVDADLQERVQELESSLTLKVQEVEEADDRVREALKDKGKLEKKIAKLQRQLAAATANADPETAANTAANKRISQQLPTATPMGPPPRPVPASAPAISALTPKINTPAPSPRHPLRSVNIVVDAKMSPGGGLKRAREEKGDEKPLPAECILLPPAQLEGTTPRSLKAVPRFKPQRTVSGEVGTPRKRINIFSGDS